MQENAISGFSHLDSGGMKEYVWNAANLCVCV